MIPQISILIPTHDRAHDLRQTLKSLNAEMAGRRNAEVLVLANGSPPGFLKGLEEEQTERPWLRILEFAEGNKCRALNHAIAATEGEVVVFTDDDMRFEPGWLNELAEPLLQGDAFACGGRIRNPADRRAPWILRSSESEGETTERYLPLGGRNLVGSNLAVHRKAFSFVPEFDPALGPGGLGFFEDTLFSLQLKQAGCRMLYAPRAIAWHHFPLDRFQRSVYVDRQERIGYCEGYAAYHWAHEDPPESWLRAELNGLKPRRESIRNSDAPMTGHDLATLRTYGRWSYFLDNLGTPRNYKLRGLARKG